MNVFGVIVSILLSGLIVGALARLALPGRDPMSIPMTIAIGVAGAVVGGIIGLGVGVGSYFTLLLFQIAAAAAIVYFVRRSRGGGLTDPGAPPVD
jgi:uncharacterized membrane protein YeaQ/YmgE (transglycosylase-associated protein family)